MNLIKCYQTNSSWYKGARRNSSSCGRIACRDRADPEIEFSENWLKKLLIAIVDFLAKLLKKE